MFINASTDVSGLIISEEKKAESVLFEPIASLAPLVLPNLLAEVENYRKDEEPVNEEFPKEEE